MSVFDHKEDIETFRIIWLDSTKEIKQQLETVSIDFDTHYESTYFKRLIKALQNPEKLDLCVQYNLIRTYEIVNRQQCSAFVKLLQNFITGDYDNLELLEEEHYFPTKEPKLILDECFYKSSIYKKSDKDGYDSTYNNVTDLGGLINARDFSLKKQDYIRRVCLIAKESDLPKLILKVTALENNKLKLPTTPIEPGRLISV